jgi:NDP-sugar pyrophosphorylase family protein
MMYPMIILAGGLATRLGLLTKNIPKSLIEINGKPFIFHQLEYLKRQNFSRVIICVAHLGSQIEDLVGSGDQFGLNVLYSHDGDRLLGTGGAVKKALSKVGRNFFVMYGDSYLPINFENFQIYFEKLKKNSVMAIIKNENKWDRSNVSFSSNKSILYNKSNLQNIEMNYVDYGVSILDREVFNDVQDNVSIDLSIIYHQLSMNGQLGAFEVHERFYEIGSPEGIQEATDYLKRKDR